MKFAVIGGDLRAVRLAGLLLREGHRVHSFALERAELPEEVSKAGCLEAAVYGVDCVALPCPSERDGRLLAPFSAAELGMEELLGALWPGQRLFGGGFSERSRSQALCSGLLLSDLLRDPRYLMENALLTAEGALGLLLTESERSLFGSRCVLCGWGRLARLLAPKLSALGAKVTVAARREEQRAECRALGYEGCDYPALGEALMGCDYLINTVPQRVISNAQLCCLPETALLLELASHPGGYDRSIAEQLGLRCLSAPGLPGRASPLSAAKITLAAIGRRLEQEED